MKNKSNGSRCQGQTKAGKPCRAAATASGLCYFHGNPKKASELGRIGGRQNKRFPQPDGLAPLGRLDKAKTVVETGERLMEELRAERIHPRVADSMTRLLSLQLRAIEVAELEERVAELLRRRMAQQESSNEQPESRNLLGLTPENPRDSR